MKDYRNWSLGVLYIMLCAFLGWIAGSSHVTEIGATLSGAGLGVGSVVGLRALNKWAERRPRVE